MPGSRRKILDHVFTGLCARMNRRKTVSDDVLDMPLRRSLSTFDLTLFGVGNMIAVGVYVMAGSVAHSLAGPGAVLSLFFAGGAGLLSALCYADLAAANPRAGSAYAYLYSSLGEFWAFVVAWNLILEHIIGACALARAWSGYVDSLADGAVRNLTRAIVGGARGSSITLLHHANASGVAAHSHDTLVSMDVDVLAMVIVLCCTLLLATGTRGSPFFSSVLVMLNLLVIVVFVVLGFLHADLHNWTLNAIGSISPYDLKGVMVGASTSMYAFAGMETVSAAGQESRRPAVSIPAASLMSTAIALSGYLLLSAALTLVLPFTAIKAEAAIPQVLTKLGLGWLRWAMTIAALCGIASTLLGTLMYLPRIIHALSIDGLLFRRLGKINAKTHVPLTNLLLIALTVSVTALFLDLHTLVELLSIGTLVCALCLNCGVILQRYRPPPIADPPLPQRVDSPSGMTDDSDTISAASELGSPVSEVEYQVGVAPGSLRPGWPWLRALGLQSWKPGTCVTFCLGLFLLTGAFMLAVLHVGVSTYSGLAVVCSSFALLLLLVLCISAHQQIPGSGPGRGPDGCFRAPFVPWMPTSAILLNQLLLMNLSELAWLRFAAWSTIGLVIYFLYGIRHSSEADRRSAYNVLLRCGEARKGAWGAAWGASAKAPQTTPATPATAPMLHAPQPPASHDKLPILDHEELQD